MHARVSLALIASLAGGCCLGGSPPTEAPLEPPSTTTDPDRPAPAAAEGLFLYASADRADGIEVPARLRAPIPSTLAAVREWPTSAPPRAQVQARLCAGDRATIAQWLDAAASAAHDAPVSDVALAYANLVRYCDGPWLADLRARASGTLARGARETALLVLGRAGAAEDEATMIAADAPAIATVEWIGARTIEQPLTPALASRLVTALEAQLELASPSTDDILEPCALDSTRAVDRLVAAHRVDDLMAMHARLRGAHADCLAVELGRIDDPRARATYADGCPRVRAPALCTRDAADAPVAATEAADVPARTVDEEVRDYDFDVASVPESGARRDAVLTALDTCAVGQDYTARGCLTSLAALDRARAASAARAWLAAHPDADDDGDLARALDHFPEDGSVVAYLRGLGLLPSSELPTRVSRAVAPLDALLEAGRATSFDTETGQFPNEHDALMVELTALAPDALAGVVFEEVVNGTPGGVALGDGVVVDQVVGDQGEAIEGDAPEGDYVLHAYDGTTRYEAVAENLGDWYDVDTVLGLLDTVARQRGSDVRWLMLRTGDQTAIVVAGPAAGLERAVADGWLVPSGLGASAASRDHEREMIEQLLGSGQLGR